MYDEIEYFEPVPEPDPVDWQGNVLKVGDRVMYGVWYEPDVISERALAHVRREPDPYAATIVWFEWDEGGLYMGILFYTGEKETIHSYYTTSHGDPAMEFGDVDKVCD